jgi:hypothetical protein
MQSVSVRFGCGRDKLRLSSEFTAYSVVAEFTNGDVQSKLPKNFNTKKKPRFLSKEYRGSI